MIAIAAADPESTRALGQLVLQRTQKEPVLNSSFRTVGDHAEFAGISSCIGLIEEGSVAT